MREILFRGKRKDNGEWVVSNTFYQCDEKIKLWDEPNRDGYVEIGKDTVGQYTGLTDKNGTKIFEGDIVAQNWYDRNEPADDSFGEVVFCEYDCSFSVIDVEKDGIVPLGKCHAYYWEAEVIGNIHDNPELLGGAGNG